MSELTAIQIIDIVLNHITNWKWGPESDGEIYGYIVKQYPELDGKQNFGSEILRVIRKLEKDGYIYSDLKSDGITIDLKYHYKITFEGKLFSEQGGYAQQLINDSSENTRLEKIERRATINRKTVTFLTWLIAAGTLVATVYYGIEIWKFLFNK